jgi:hypothetical protein
MNEHHKCTTPADSNCVAVTREELAQVEGGGSLLDQVVQVAKATYEIVRYAGQAIA